MTAPRLIAAAGLVLLAACEPEPTAVDLLTDELVAARATPPAEAIAAALARQEARRAGAQVSDLVRLEDVSAEGPVVIYSLSVNVDTSALTDAERADLGAQIRPAFVSAVCPEPGANALAFDAGVVVRSYIYDAGGLPLDGFDVTRCA